MDESESIFSWRFVSAVLTFVVLWVVGTWLFGEVVTSRIILLLPIVAIVIGAIVFLAYALHVRRVSRLASARESAGLCVKCGYDVRSSGDLCPECGMPIWRRRDPATGKIANPPEIPSGEV